MLSSIETIAFDPIFKYSTQDGNIIKFLNLRIIRSIHGISLDQTQHIIMNILNSYWKNKNTENVPWQSAPFPTDPKFEHALFLSLPLTTADTVYASDDS